MDLLETLRAKVSSLQDGPHSAGLRSIILHIETAFRHLSRGQSEQDETAFTDAVYRTNQAFEGSVKEAYRVLAEKNPDRKRPHEIEKYLERNQIFRPRVLSQFTTYRKEWRNPSTHDYKLDFDESEAFLAIVNISAFSCLVLDQITQQLARNYAKSKSQPPTPPLGGGSNVSFLEELSAHFCAFSQQQDALEPSTPKKTEVQVLGALAGFLESISDDLIITVEPQFRHEKRRYRADMLISRGDMSVLVELKRYRGTQDFIYSALEQVQRYMHASSIREAILYFFDDKAYNPDVSLFQTPSPDTDGRIAIIGPFVHEGSLHQGGPST